jgi:hypothetical protein
MSSNLVTLMLHICRVVKQNPYALHVSGRALNQGWWPPSRYIVCHTLENGGLMEALCGDATAAGDRERFLSLVVGIPSASSGTGRGGGPNMRRSLSRASAEGGVAWRRSSVYEERSGVCSTSAVSELLSTTSVADTGHKRTSSPPHTWVITPGASEESPS